MTQLAEIFLVDNGSLRPEATLALRGLAEALTSYSGGVVHPVSLLHSHRVPDVALGGRAARTVKRALREGIIAGKREFVIVPLFLGPSRAIIEYLPGLVSDLRVDTPDLQVRIADPLAGPDPTRPDERLARILAHHVTAVAAEKGMSSAKVALVDHGTPTGPVNALRDAVARQLSELLAAEVVAASMERRAGAEYDFNEPLLQRVDRVAGFAGGDLIVAMFFLLPGRHAGAGGDVASICEGLLAAGRYVRIEQTPLLGTHSMLLAILNDRLQAML